MTLRVPDGNMDVWILYLCTCHSCWISFMEYFELSC